MVLSQDIVDMIFLACDMDELSRTRTIQSDYVKELTEYNDMKYAALYGNFMNLKWLYKKGAILYHSVFQYAAKNTKPNAIQILTWLKEKNCPHSSDMLYYSYMHIPIDISRWLNHNICKFGGCYYNAITEYINDSEFDLVKYHKNMGVFTEDMYVYAVITDDFDAIKWLYENDCPYDNLIFEISIEFNNLEIIEFLHEKIHQKDGELPEISQYTSLETLKWLHEKDYFLSLITYVSHVSVGDLDIMEFLYNIDEDKDDDKGTGMLSHAIRRCNLETLQFLYNKGYPCNKRKIIIEAIPNSNVGVLAFLLEIGGYLDEDIDINDNEYNLVLDIIKWDNVEMLKYFITKGLEQDEYMFQLSIEKESMRIIHYLYRVGCPYYEDDEDYILDLFR